MKLVLEELNREDFALPLYPTYLKHRPGVFIVDAKSVFDNVSRGGNKLP